MGHKVTLDARKRLAMHALVRGCTKQEAAQRAGVSRKTVHAWLQDPEFRDEFERIRGEVAAAELDVTLEFLRDRLELRRWALRTLRELAGREDVPLGFRVRMLTALLDADGASAELERILIRKNDPLPILQSMQLEPVLRSRALAEDLSE